MIVAAVILLGLFVYPLWNIMLGAPQYPDPLGMNIHIDKLVGHEEFDLQNIDNLNHYIGMKKLPKPGEMWEFDVFPKVVIGMVILGVLIGFAGLFNIAGPGWFLFWFVLMSVLGTLGVYDFNVWLTDYGSDLDPQASLKILAPDGSLMTYKPPLLGHKKILNFDAYSYPETGAFILFFSILLAFFAYFVGRKEWRKRKQKQLQPSPAKKESGSLKELVLAIFIFWMATGCSISPQKMEYGIDVCYYCSMTIVDEQHAAQLVTSKGRAYKFDAIECMINQMDEMEGTEFGLLLVNDYRNPGELIDATSSTFLISSGIPSPMGANLSGFSKSEDADKAKEQFTGETYTWSQLLKLYEGTKAGIH